MRETRKAKRRRRIITNLARITGWKCHYCGIDVGPTSAIKATLDHIVPLAKGGQDTAVNSCVACLYCNRAKADNSLIEFQAWLDFVRSTSGKN